MNLFWRLVLSSALFVFIFVFVRVTYLYAIEADLVALTCASVAWVICFVLLGLIPRNFFTSAKEEATYSEKKKAKYCIACGYCLRGNESGICPECGEPVDTFYDKR